MPRFVDAFGPLLLCGSLDTGALSDAMRRVAIACVVVLVVVVAQAHLRRSESGDKASAIGSLKAVAEAQTLYAARNGGYAAALASLSRGCPGSSPSLPS